MTRTPFRLGLICWVLACSPVWVSAPMGCSSGPVEYAPGPRTDYINASDAVTSTIALLRAARADGKIDDGDWVRTVNPAIQRANSAMDEWEAAVLDGTAEEIGTAKTIANALLAEIRTHLASSQLRGGS